MKRTATALAAAIALVFSVLITACGSPASNQGGAGGSGTATAESTAPAAPALDGRWRQVGHADGEDGMVGAIDGDAIALNIRTNGSEWVYWYGTFNAPKDTSAHTWTSKANKAYMTGLLASQSDTKDFSYANGKITFEFTMQGETTTIEMEQASQEAGLLADLRSGEGAAPEVDAQIKDLELVDSNYILDNGYVKYALAIKNPNDKYAPQFANISIVGRASDGSISFSDTSGTNVILPGATTYWAGQAGNGNVTESDTIEFKVTVDDDQWYQTSEKYDFYNIGNLSTSTDTLGDLHTTGEIVLLRDVNLKSFGNANNPSLTCVLKDANGKIITGFSTYLMSELKVGESTPFDINSMFDAVDFATVEVYANPWI